jgi:hypothetical protein
MTRHVEEFDFRLMRRGMKPRNLERVNAEFEVKESLGKLAIDVFMCASNSGATFQEALLAVYLTGLENGSSAMREVQN